MSNNLEINQPGSLGDIFFVQKLCKELSKEYNVFHSVTSQMWACGLEQLETHVNFGPNLSIPSDGLYYDCSGQYRGRPLEDVMTAKYLGCDMDWRDWADYFKYTRNHERETRLRELFNIKENEPFILANKNYGFNFIHNGVENSIPKDYDGKVIWMSPSITPKIFDWCWMLENAEEIHIVETSINYIVDTLNLKAKKLISHPRHYEHTRMIIERLFSAPWQWVDYTEEEWKQYVKN